MLNNIRYIKKYWNKNNENNQLELLKIDVNNSLITATLYCKDSNYVSGQRKVEMTFEKNKLEE